MVAQARPVAFLVRFLAGIFIGVGEADARGDFIRLMVFFVKLDLADVSGLVNALSMPNTVFSRSFSSTRVVRLSRYLFLFGSELMMLRDSVTKSRSSCFVRCTALPVEVDPDILVTVPDIW
jgi:hypothetical protein